MNQPNAEFGDSEQKRVGQGVGSRNEQNQPLLVLAIDDDPGVLSYYETVIRRLNFRFESSCDSGQALDLIATCDPSLVILDVAMPGINGMELLRHIKIRNPQTRVAVITGNCTIDMAVEAIQEGAIDYIGKPITVEKLRNLVTRVRSLVAQEVQNRTPTRELLEGTKLDRVICRSPRMLEVFGLVRRVAPHFRTALIVGEPGTGRKVVARTLHNLSPGRAERFTILNCQPIADKLVEMQLSKRGTGGSPSGRVGRIDLLEMDLTGTIFLEEIGELGGVTQLKLLRFLDRVSAQERCSPLTPQRALRIVASTSRDLQADIQSGRFRADLWYRLNMVQIQLPALRERGDDVLLLARNLLAQFTAQSGKVVRRMSRAAEAALLAYSWPGNISELENVVGRACGVAHGEILDCGDLPVKLTQPGNGGAVQTHGEPSLDTGTR